MSDTLPESKAERRDLLALQAAIDKSIVRRAAELTMAEKLRMGADLYDDGIRWLRQIDRLEGGREAIEAAGLTLKTLLTVRDFGIQ